ncbi:Peptidyl-prolyl cis-trans isomerase CYP95, partial [Camellia lanceoleosa]
MSKKLPLVFLDVSIDGVSAEKMVFELFSDVAPKTAENFRALYTGEKGISPKTGRPLHYKGSFFHSIVKGSMAQRRTQNFNSYWKPSTVLHHLFRVLYETINGTLCLVLFLLEKLGNKDDFRLVPLFRSHIL